MALTFEPIAPYHHVITFLVLISLAAVLPHGLPRFNRHHVFGRRPQYRYASLVLTVLGLMLFLPAAHNPILVRHLDTSKQHMVLLVDTSDSALRGFSSFGAYKSHLQQRIRPLLETVDQGTLVSLVLFGQNATVSDRLLPVKRLERRLAQLGPGDLPAGNSTSIEQGLNTARTEIANAGYAGGIILISDGNQMEGDALKAASQCAMQATTVHTMALPGRLPALAIQAANLPQLTNQNESIYLRGLIANRTRTTAKVQLTLEQDTGGPQPERATINATLAPGDKGRIRQPVAFQRKGLQYIALSLQQKEGEITHRRRLFTMVTGPPRLLSIGGDRAWETVYPEAAITFSSPGQLQADLDFNDFDGIVISGSTADRFQPGVLDKITDAVTSAGVGLMFLNGPHHRGDDQPTVLYSYKETSLATVLPVSCEPRPDNFVPPSRNLVLMVDASGSMGGAPLAQAVAICDHIIQNHMRPQDSLDLIAFNTASRHLIKNRKMDGSGKRAALNALRGISSGGGTDPRDALSLLDGRSMNECGLIFISDGGFGAVSARPDCAITVFGIGLGSGESQALADIADPIVVGPHFNPKNVRLRFFEPVKRDKYFESGRYKPATVQWMAQTADALPIPDLFLNGSAVSYARSGARVNAFRPKLVDPVLAFIEVGQGRIGTLTTGLSQEWLRADEGRTAVKAWIQATLPFTEQERYRFEVRDLGDALQIHLTVTAPEGVPQLDSLSADLDLNGVQRGLAFRVDPTRTGEFIGLLQLDGIQQGGLGRLYLREAGAGALGQTQRIPFQVPSPFKINQPTLEDQSFGANIPLLKRISALTAGQFQPEDLDNGRSAREDGQTRTYLWSWFTLGAVLCIVGSIAVTRMEP